MQSDNEQLELHTELYHSNLKAANGTIRDKWNGIAIRGRHRGSSITDFLRHKTGQLRTHPDQ